jgi:hypothetical protein
MFELQSENIWYIFLFQGYEKKKGKNKQIKWKRVLNLALESLFPAKEVEFHGCSHQKYRGKILLPSKNRQEG